jgi:MYXO-CTERM domain-containing protein
MRKFKSNIILGILFIAALVSFFPLGAQAEIITLGDNFQRAEGFWGEIYGSRGNFYNSNDDMVFFCVDPNHHFGYNPTDYMKMPLVTTPIYGTGSYLQAAWLMNTYAPSISGYLISGYNAATTGAAVQLAIFQLLGLSWVGSGWTPSALLQNLAQGLINKGIPSVGDITGLSTIYAIYVPTVEGSSQVLIGQNPPAGPPVPIPPTAWLLGAGLVGLFGLRRRFGIKGRIQ